jgi:hypothetical protein
MADYLSTKSQALEYILSFSQRLQEYKRNIYQKKKTYQVEILEPPRFYFVDVDDFSTIVESGDKSTAQVARFKGRITDNKLAHKSFLTNPNDEKKVADLQTRELLVSMHTDIVLYLGSGSPALEEGSIIVAKLEPGDNNYLYNLQTAKMILVETDSNGVANTTLPPSQTSAKTTFDNTQVVPEVLGPATTEELPIEIDDSNTDLFKDQHLIVWYGGQGPNGTYGADYVFQQIIDLGLTGDKRIWVPLEYSDTPESAQRKINNAIAGSDITKISMGAWSGGVGNLTDNGLAAFLNAYGVSKINNVVLADPAPYPAIVNIYNTNREIASKTTMYYLPDWWVKTYGSPAGNWNVSGPTLKQMAANISSVGGTAIEQKQYSSLVRSATSGEPVLGNNNINAQAHINILQDCLKLIAQ